MYHAPSSWAVATGAPQHSRTNKHKATSFLTGIRSARVPYEAGHHTVQPVLGPPLGGQLHGSWFELRRLHPPLVVDCQGRYDGVTTSYG